MTFTRITDRQTADSLIARSDRRHGHETGVASGKFQGGYHLPDGSVLDHYLNFGWQDVWFLYAPDHREPPVNRIIDRLRDGSR